MRSDPLPALIKKLQRDHTFDTLILYGSHARGDATAASDYDLLAIRKGGRAVVRDTRKWRGAYLDLFIYPERKVKPEDLLRLRGGRVLVEHKGSGARLLKKIERRYAKGPERLSADERQARKTWAHKMLDRARRGDLEGDFRRAWLLMALLEDYFALRNLWYEGPKMAFVWLQVNDRSVKRLFERALKPGAGISAIEKLVTAVAGAIIV